MIPKAFFFFFLFEFVRSFQVMFLQNRINDSAHV